MSGTTDGLPGSFPEVERRAQEWFQHLDAGDIDSTWHMFSGLFRDAIDEPTWKAKLEPVIESCGTATTRVLESQEFHEELPGVPPGNYAIRTYQTQFHSGLEVRERLTLVRETDGGWGIAGYYLV